MSKFIKLTTGKDGKKLSVRKDLILQVSEYDIKTSKTGRVTQTYYESMEHVKSMITVEISRISRPLYDEKLTHVVNSLVIGVRQDYEIIMEELENED